MIKTTNHTLKFSNKNKLDKLSSFIDEYRRVTKLILDDIWTNGYTWEIDGKIHTFNVEKDLLEHPNFIDYNKFKIETTLSARALSSLVTQLAGIIGASVEKQRKRMYMFDLQCNENKYNELLYRKICANKPQKPFVDNLNPELSSKCVDWQESGYFNGFLRLKSIGEIGHIKLPIKFHKHSIKYVDWTKLNSYLIGKDFINIRWEKDIPKLKEDGRIVGVDQGVKTCLTLSDGQITQTNKDGWNLDKILDEMTKKKKGSKSFKKCQDHRKNYINWSINKLNLINVKQINLEEIWNIGYKNKSSRKLRCWTNTLIRDKLESKCELLGVQVQHQSPTYKSQRCSGCGMVRKSSRKGKNYLCPNCGLEIDADFNASQNHEQVLPDIPIKLRKLNLNRKGFFWKETGFYDLNGVELRVPLDPIIK